MIVLMPFGLILLWTVRQNAPGFVKGDLLISITGEPGKTTVADRNLGQAYVSQHVALVRLRDRQLSYFTTRFLQSRTGQEQFGRMVYGQTRPGLNLLNVSATKVAVPTLQEQQTIAGLLVWGGRHNRRGQTGAGWATITERICRRCAADRAGAGGESMMREQDIIT